VSILGEGEEVVVLGHGFGTDQTCWKHVAPIIGREYKVVLFDLAGAGNTDPEQFDFERYRTLHGYVDDLLDILDELGIERCIYLGHSMSGMIGLMAAIMRPSLFSKVITINSSPRFLNDTNYKGGFELEDLRQIFTAMQTNFRAWVDGFVPLIVGADFTNPVIQEFTRTFFNIRPDIALLIAKAAFTSDMRALLPKVTVPCHIIQSSTDAAVPFEVGWYIQQHVGGKACLEILECNGHIPQLTAPNLLLPALLHHIMARLD